METSIAKRHRQDVVDRSPGVIFTLSVPSKLQIGSNAILSCFDQVPKDSAVEIPVENDDLTVSEQISIELMALKKESKSYRFGCELSRGVGFIAFNGSLSPTKFIHTFLSSHCPPISPPFVSRLIPIEIVCAPNLASFTAVCVPQIAKKFAGYAVDRSWKLIFDKHALTNLSKENVLDLLHSAIEERHEASITAPDVVLMVQTFQSVCGIAFLENYDELAEYNIRKLVSKRNTECNDNA